MKSLLKKITSESINDNKGSNSYLSILKHSTTKTHSTSSFENRKRRKSARFIADTIIDKLYYDEYFKSAYKIINIMRNKTSKGVLLVQSLIDHNQYICKIREYADDVENEIDVYNILSHKYNINVAFYKEYRKHNDYVYFIIEYVDGDDLYKYSKKNRFKVSEIKNLVLQIAKGLQFLHKNNILHNDLKLDNIMLDNNSVIKIIDFDLSRVCEEGEFISSGIFGTPRYIAPESYDLNIYSKNTDLWAVGIILHAIITGKFPININMPIEHSYSNLNRRNFFKHIDKNIIYRYIRKKTIDQSLCTILMSLLEFNDEKRIKLETVIEYLS